MKVWVFNAHQGGMKFASDGVKARLLEHMKEHEGGVYRVIYEEKTRSLPQNALYWVYLSVIAAETGHDEEELHELFKQKFLPTRFLRTKDGKEYRVPKSTTKLKKHEFGEYLEKICAATNIPIPNPEDAGYISNT